RRPDLRALRAVATSRPGRPAPASRRIPRGRRQLQSPELCPHDRRRNTSQTGGRQMDMTKAQQVVADLYAKQDPTALRTYSRFEVRPINLDDPKAGYKVMARHRGDNSEKTEIAR